MSQTVVIYHSGYGHTKRVAEQVAQGANAQLVAIDAGRQHQRRGLGHTQ